VHRGPDQQAVVQGGCASLGAVRLSIIDVAGGDQPISTADGNSTIAFNGEIYNHAELRRELEQRGHRFRTRCDTEVALRAFLEWDIDSFSRLRGMFAIAIWQEAEKRLILARDRAGIKPLYIARRNGELYFGSELKALFVHPEISRTLDLEGLGHYLTFNYVPGPFTLVQGIRKLPPGEWLEWRDGKERSGAYWKLEFRRRPWKLEDAKAELDRLLRESVREHLISDVPLGVWSSGGLDSSTMVHYASEAFPGRLKTFSVSFRGRNFDESPYFREVAARYGTDHHEFDLNPSVDLPAAIEQIPYYSDEPSADAGALPVWFLSKMTRRHVTVALSGEGADELFGGYYTYLADRYARWLRWTPAALRRLALRAAALWPVADDKISFEYKLKRFLKGSLLSPDEAHVYWNGAFSRQERRELLRVETGESLQALFASQPPDPGSRYLSFDHTYYLPDDILYKCDRMSMAHSIEVRPAFLDHRIIEFAASLPPRLKVRGRTLKYVLRELMRDKLPAAVIRRAKEGFDIPAHDWFRGPLRDLLRETVTAEAAERTGIFRGAAVEALVRQHLSRRANLGFQLWGLLILFLWIRQWRIQTGPELAAALPSSQLRS
jgi:asparagine synthase (glutamine-hydrolysing)